LSPILAGRVAADSASSAISTCPPRFLGPDLIVAGATTCAITRQSGHPSHASDHRHDPRDHPHIPDIRTSAESDGSGLRALVTLGEWRQVYLHASDWRAGAVVESPCDRAQLSVPCSSRVQRRPRLSRNSISTGSGGVVGGEPLPGCESADGLAGWDESDELGFVGFAVGDGVADGNFVDRHLTGVVHVEVKFRRAGRRPRRLDPGADLDRLVSSRLLGKGLLPLVLASEKDHAGGEGADGAEGGEHVG